MCDYSLHGVANRPAKVGDKLVSTIFANCLTRGFSEVGQPKVAVCLLPGTELDFERPVEQHHFLYQLVGWMRYGKSNQKVARFTQVNMERADTHHDALEFPNGKIIMVNRLRSGQKATVLQLPAKAKIESPAKVAHEVRAPHPADRI